MAVLVGSLTHSAIAVKDFAPVDTAATPRDSRVGSSWRCPRALRWSGIVASRSGSGGGARGTVGSTGRGVVRDDDMRRVRTSL